MRRSTVVVSGSLSYKERRAAAAREHELGLDIVTLPLLAGRLAGGFSRAANRADLLPLISEALGTLQFEEFETVSGKPGMARAVLASLTRIWAAGISFGVAGANARLRDLSLVETYVREGLPTGMLLPADLCADAVARVANAQAVLGAVHFDRLVEIDPVWRPLVEALSKVVDVTWEAAGIRDRRWFPRSVDVAPIEPREQLVCELCADPRAEVVEALRWARSLLSDGVTQAADIAIISADTSTWDDHMVVLSADAELPVHFANGRPALSTRAGQTCAALADIMMNGLSQDRLRRLCLLSPYLSEVLPADWMRGIPDEAGLFEFQHWRRALRSQSRSDGIDIGSILLPVIEALTVGPADAPALGEMLLSGQSLGLWREALRLAPAPAVEMTLSSLRVADERDPASAVVWASASEMIGAPRRYMRLIGLSSRSWPRAELEDPLLPDHLIGRRSLVPFPRLERDRIAFEILTTHPGSDVILSRSRRSGEGSFLAKSALLQTGVTESPRARTRTPEHAFSEGDRLLARPVEANRHPRIQQVTACWTRWSRELEPTPHDGLAQAGHPSVIRSLRQPQSATSLRRLLRDPLGYVWRYVLGMSAPEIALQPLQLDPMTFGTLVHELLRIAVDILEPDPGLVHASPEEIDQALATAATSISDSWPLRQAVPPRLLWLDTIAEARRRAHRGLTLDEKFGPGTRSWSELAFGGEGVGREHPGPWSSSQVVVVGRAAVPLRGRIDRVDIKPDRRTIRMTDYKTGDAPRTQQEVILGGGSEVQRTLYAIAIKQLVPEVTQVVSRLAYLESQDRPSELKGDDLDRAEEAIVRYVDIAVDQASAGLTLPGPDAFDRFNDLRLALPANLDSYRARKEEGFRTAMHHLTPLWAER